MKAFSLRKQQGQVFVVVAISLVMLVATAGLAVDCVEVPMSSASGYGLLRDEAPGRAKLVFAASGGPLLGATFAGTEVAELVHAATVAVVGRLTAATLWHAVPSYPTSSEVWLRLLEAYRDR